MHDLQYILTDHVHVVTITQHGQTVSETMSYMYRQAFALRSFEKFLASSRASLAYSNGSEPSHYATSNLFL